MTVAGLAVLFDLNVILDVLQHRAPFYDASARVWAAAEHGTIRGMVAAHSITTLYYLAARDRSPGHARVFLTDILQTLTVAPVDQQILEQALNLAYADFEDAVQMMAAVRAGAQYIVTRNVDDFKYGPLPVLKPTELLAIL